MNNSQYKQRLVELERLLSDVIAYFAGWEALTSDDEELVQAMNRYKGFFTPARGAFQQMMMIQAAKAFDRDSRTASFPNLIKAARGNPTDLAPRLSDADFEEIGHESAEIEDVVRRLSILRNQRLAHLDSTVGDHADRTVRYGAFRDLIEAMKRLFNRLSSAFEGRHVAFDNLPSEAKRHIGQVQELVREDLRRARQRMNQLG